MKRQWWRWVAALVMALPLAVHAQPLAQRIPADALVYAGWCGSETAGIGYEGSHLKAVMDASNVQKFISESLPKLAQLAGRTNPEAPAKLQANSGLVGLMWRHPTAFYFGGMDLTNIEKPMPRMALLCDAGKEADTLAAQLKDMLAKSKQEQQEVPLELRRDGNVVIVTIGTLSPEQAAALQGKSTAALPLRKEFQAALTQVGGKPSVLCVYADAPGLLKLADEGVAMGNDPRAKAMWPKVSEALGFRAVTQAVLAGGFDGKDWSVQAFVGMSDKRVGLLRLLDGKPLDETMLKLVPVTTTWVKAGTFDLAGLVGAIREGVGSVEPGAKAQLDQQLQQANAIVGMDIEHDFLGSFGEQWLAYTAPSVAGSGLAGMVVVNRPKDAVKLEQGLLRLQQLAGALVQQQAQSSGQQIAFAETQSGSVKIHYLAIPIIAPSWAIKDGNLYMGLYPQVVAAAVESAKPGGPTVLDNPAFVAMRKRLGAKSVTSLSFADLPKSAPDGYQALLALSQLMIGALDMQGLQTPAMVLPPLHRIMPEITPAGSATWSDAAGWHLKAVEPFPGSLALGVQQGAVLGQNAMLVAVLLPSLGRARELVNRSTSAANIRGILVSCMMYAGDNGDRYPPDLGTLVLQNKVSVRSFVSKSSGTVIPPSILNGTLAEQAQWVNENSDFVYVGAGMANTAAADAVLVYEKYNPMARKEGINIGFADGHVEFVKFPEAEEMIRKTRRATGRRSK